ncbi:hypothetical protein Mycsm_06523 (plasmid) [Mycobacterium sp. JS623]|uniref:endonuclease/exonuclease/phosphatase family protein n=1 Tax=Mycobacterium sp. JS623 TaxID=212767 RepID=UPI0002A56441|nr:endonuclease/exonuclease/phosphatase family protein [Mycobacterium sp. JS623]AGB26663.1 hypothetical protein Mycsm_06523 [Mycobacterium sp. JS623]
MRSALKTTILGLVASLGLTVAAAGVTARHLPITNHIALVAAAFSLYLIVVAPLAVSVILVSLSRHWAVVTTAVALVVFSVFSQTGATRTIAAAPSRGITLRVMTANLRLGNADSNTLVRNARDNADIFAVQELTPEAAQRLKAAGLEASFPYHFGYPVEGGGGTGLWSRYPLVSPTFVAGFQMVFISSRIALPRWASDIPWVLVTHLSGPWPQAIKDWRGDIEALRRTMRSTAKAAGHGAVVVVGDFNSTLDMRPFRELLGEGYTDAGQSTGAPYLPTFPADAAPVPPFLGIDHALLRNCTATAVRTIPQLGSDHRALIVDVDLPK